MAGKKTRNTGLPKITQLPSGAYHATVYSHKDAQGKRVYESFTSFDYAALTIEIANFKAQKKSDKIEESQGRVTLTVGEAIDQYIDMKSSVLSPSTIRSYKAVRRSSLQSIMGVKVSDLTREQVQRAVNVDAVHLSPKSVRNAHGLLTATLTVYRPDFSLFTTLPQKKKAEIQVPTEEEVNILVEASKGTPMELPIILAACCGLRRSEIAALTWKCVDFEKKTLTVKGAVVRNDKNEFVKKGTKTAAGTRTIRLFPFVLDALTRAKGKAHANDPCINLTPSQISDTFRTITTKAEVRPMRFHDLRHYTVSVMLSLNIPKNYIADYVGHETENMIDRVYGHIMASRKTTVEDQLQDYFSSVFSVKK